MNGAQRVLAALIVPLGLGVLVWLFYRLLRWARSGTGGAHMLGAVLTDVTQSSAVHEAKQSKKLGESDGGDPPTEK